MVMLVFLYKVDNFYMQRCECIVFCVQSAFSLGFGEGVTIRRCFQCQ